MVSDSGHFTLNYSSFYILMAGELCHTPFRRRCIMLENYVKLLYFPLHSILRTGDVIFVTGRRYRQFRDEILPHIKHRVILISHNYDKPQAVDMYPILDNPYVVHWFARNLHFDHPMATAIPIGVTRFFVSIMGKLKDPNLR